MCKPSKSDCERALALLHDKPGAVASPLGDAWRSQRADVQRQQRAKKKRQPQGEKQNASHQQQQGEKQNASHQQQQQQQHQKLQQLKQQQQQQLKQHLPAPSEAAFPASDATFASDEEEVEEPRENSPEVVAVVPALRQVPCDKNVGRCYPNRTLHRKPRNTIVRIQVALEAVASGLVHTCRDLLHFAEGTFFWHEAKAEALTAANVARCAEMALQDAEMSSACDAMAQGGPSASADPSDPAVIESRGALATARRVEAVTGYAVACLGVALGLALRHLLASKLVAVSVLQVTCCSLAALLFTSCVYTGEQRPLEGARGVPWLLLDGNWW